MENLPWNILEIHLQYVFKSFSETKTYPEEKFESWS